MQSEIDYYAILGLLPSAETIVVRAAYRALASRYHPDVWRGDKTYAEGRMAEINEAYRVLSDETLRREYDRKIYSHAYDQFDADPLESEHYDSDLCSQAWQVALEYYPDLSSLTESLAQTSRRLAFHFKSKLLETKEFEDRHKVARSLEDEFLRLYFGADAKILAFARRLIAAGNKIAARDLNKAVSVLGANPNADVVISRIKRVHFSAPAKAAKEWCVSVRETEHVGDATGLIEALGGNIDYVKAGWFREEIIVTVTGHREKFCNERDMVVWVIQTLVPNVLQRGNLG